MNSKRITSSWNARFNLFRRAFKLAGCGLLVAFAGSEAVWADTDSEVSLKFQNNTGVSSSQIYIQFLGGGSVSGTFTDSLTGNPVILQANTSYSLAQLQSSTLDLSQFSGRIYVNYGAYGLANLGANNGGYTPAAALTTDPNYNTRYQYFETTITPQPDGSSTYYGDLSYIDFTAMSMSMQAYTSGTINPTISNSNQISANTYALVNATSGSAVMPSFPVLPSGASSILPNSTFARVISPQFAPTTTYHTFANYLDYLGATTTGSITAGGTAILPGAKSVTLAGVFVGTGSQPSGNPATQAQTYYLTGTFNESGGIVLTSNQYASGLTTGVAGLNNPTGAPGVTGTLTITISGAALNDPNGIYGNNVPYTVTLNGTVIETTTGITNDVYGRAVGDLLAGLSFGYVGSTQPFTLVTSTGSTTTTLGNLPSSAWWASGQAQGNALTYIPTVTGSTVSYVGVIYGNTPSGTGDYFSKAQPDNPDFYDGYAASIGGTTVLTTGYGFPLQDRLGNNLLSYNTGAQGNTQIVLTLNPDGTTPILTGIWTGGVTGTQTTSNWNTSGNWLVNGSGPGGTTFANGVPVSGATVQFQGTGTGTASFTVNTATEQHVNGIDFNYNADTFTLTGTTIHLSGDIVNSSSHLQTIQNNLEFDATGNVVAAYGNLAFGNIDLTGTTAAIFSGDYGSTINGIVSGSGTIIMTGYGSQTIDGINPLTINGTNTLTLNGANTFSGGLYLMGGNLILGNDSAAGTGTFVLGNTTGGLAVLQAGGGNRTIANDLVLIGNVSVSGTNGFTFNGNTTLVGTTGGGTIGVNNNPSVNFAGAIGESTAGMGIVKTGTGTMTFSGSAANTFTGELAVNQGTVVLDKSANTNAYAGNLTIGTGLGGTNSAIVQIDADGQLPASQGITINTDGQLNLQSFNASTTNLVMTGGSIVGSGTLAITDTGTIGGGFQFTGDKASSATISSGIELMGEETFQVAKTLSTGPQVTISGTITGTGTSTSPINFTKTGSGILALTGTNALTGNVSVTVAGGILETTSIANASVTLNGGGLGSTSTGTTVVSPIQIKQLSVDNGAFILGLGTGGQSDQIDASGNITLSTTMGSNPTFFFTNDGFNSGTGTFTVMHGTFTGTTTPSSFQFASLGIAGLTGTFELNGNDLIFVGQAGVTGTWSGSTSGNWGTASNWSEGKIPLAGADLTITGTSNTSISTGTNQTTGAITFDSNAGAFTISGNTITLGGTLTNNSSNVQTITSNITLNAARTIAANTGAINLTGSIALSNSGAMPGELTFTGTQSISVSGNISDGTFITGTGIVNDITGGSIIMAGTGTLTLTGTNSFSGDLILENGTVSGSQATSFGLQTTNSGGDFDAANSIVFDGGSLQTTGSGTFSQFRSLLLYQTGVINTDGNNLVVQGVISGTGGLVKNGEGVLELDQTGTATNSYQGATIVNGGSLVLGYAGALGNSTAGVTVNNGASLVISQTFNMTTGEALTLSGTGDNGSGAFHLEGANILNWTGPIGLAADASMQTDPNSFLGLSGTVNVGTHNLILVTGLTSTINLSGIVSGSGGLTKTGAGELNLSGKNTNFSGMIDVKQGVVNVTLSGTVDTQPGAPNVTPLYALGGGNSSLTIESGAALQFANTTDVSVALNSITLSGTGVTAGSGVITSLNSAVATISGSVALAGDATIGTQAGQLIFTGDVNLADNTLTLESKAAQMVLSGNISGTGSITTAGDSSVLLSGTNTYSGGTTIGDSTGILVANSQGLGTGSTVVNEGGSLGFEGGISLVQNISAAGTGISSNGALENLSGNNTVTGTISISGGAVTLQSDAGVLKLNGDLVGIGGAQILSTQGYGTVNITGSISNVSVVNILSGTFAANNLAGAQLNVGQNTAFTGGSAPTFSPGGLNNVATVNIQGLGLGIGAQFEMDLGASSATSDEIITSHAFADANALGFFFNSDGITSAGGTYTLIHSNSGNLNITGPLSFTSNVVGGLSGTFITSLNSPDIIFQAYASQAIWSGTTGSGTWGDPNWKSGSTSIGTPADGSAVGFSSSTTGTIDTQQDRLVGGITFESGSAALTIVNNTVNTYGQIVNNSTSVQTISSGINLGGDTTVNAASGNVALTGAINFGGNSSIPSLTVTGSFNTIISGGISNGTGITGSLTKSGAGSLHLLGTNTFTGNTLVNGGNFILDGTTASGNTITVAAGGTISGTGTAAGHVNIAGTLSPGHSPGTLNTGSETWMTGGNYNWQITNATGAAGTGYDTVNINGSLDLGTLTSFSLNLWSLSSTGPDVSGLALNFNSSTNYSWILASTTGGIDGFDSSLFTINVAANNGADGFANPVNGTFSIAVNGDNLVLDYTAAAVPEPSTWALMALSLVGLALLARRERNKKTLSS